MSASLIYARRAPAGPRLYILGKRIHHGPVFIAAALIAAVFGRRGIAALALIGAAHDARDFPFRDCDNHDRRDHR